MRIHALLLIVCVVLAGCDSPSAPSAGVPFTVTDLVEGTGAEAMNGQTLTMNYTGWLYDANAPDNKGTVFDTTDGRGPFSFVLGAGQVIQGWDQGLVGMKVGGTRRLVIPPELAYGDQGAGGVIPPNATLIFDVELLGVQ
jgi:FKBP-type peptidyl-prolyl cis-trans isomerase